MGAAWSGNQRLTGRLSGFNLNHSILKCQESPRVYLGAIVLLVSAMQGGISDKRAADLHQRLGVSRRTLWRWRTWWRASFPESSFWKRARGRFMPALNGDELPASLLERFDGEDDRSRLFQVLSFLAPLTTQSC